MTDYRVAYKVKAAAEQASVSEDTIRRAIRATDPHAWPPPLRAKRAGSELRITHAELERWVDSLEDA